MTNMTIYQNSATRLHISLYGLYSTIVCRDDFFQLFKNCFPKVAGQGQNRSKMTILKGCVHGFSNFSLIQLSRVLRENLYLHQRFTVFKVEYFLYIIQIMLQYTPSFNKVCYTLRLQGCFL